MAVTTTFTGSNPHISQSTFNCVKTYVFGLLFGSVTVTSTGSSHTYLT